MVNQSGSYANPRLDLAVPLMEYTQVQNEFIAPMISPVLPVGRKAATYPAITRESLTRTPGELRRQSGASYARDTFDTKDKTYSCQEYGQEQKLPDDQRVFYKNDFDAAKLSTQVAWRRVQQAQEKRVANKILNTSTFTGTALYTDRSAAPWATAASDVLGHIIAAKEKVRGNCGIDANTLVLGKAVLNSVLLNTALINAVQYARIATWQEKLDTLAAYLNLKRIIVGVGIENNAIEGQVFTKNDIWGSTYVNVCITPDSAEDLSQPAIMRTFQWKEDGFGESNGIVVESYVEPQTRSEIFRARHQTDENLVDAFFGHLLKIA